MMEYTHMVAAVISDERGFSSVVAVVLMVAITVILAAVMATFTLGMAESAKTQAPQAQFEVTPVNISDGDSTNEGVKIVHESGDAIDNKYVEVVIGNTTVYDDGGDTNAGYSAGYDHGTNNWESTIAAGSTALWEEYEQVDSGETTVQVIWTDPDSRETYLLIEREYSFE